MLRAMVEGAAPDLAPLLALLMAAIIGTWLRPVAANFGGGATDAKLRLPSWAIFEG